jgi:predicted TIM-barrel fold metal-dependent hydrolase
VTDLLRGERDDRRVEGREVSTSVVDVDVHEMLTSTKDLVPHLDEPWRSRIEVNDGFKGPPGNPYSFSQPTGVAIQDAVTDDGSPVGSKLEMVQEQVLDRYDIQRAILISLFHPTDHQIQPEFATALASAYNDWVTENWLEKDDRLRSSITVAAQEPRDAAREIDRVGSDPRFVQVILPAVAYHVFGRPYYWPIFEAAQRNDLVIAFHQSDGTRTAVGLPPSVRHGLPALGLRLPGAGAAAQLPQGFEGEDTLCQCERVLWLLGTPSGTQSGTQSGTPLGLAKSGTSSACWRRSRLEP